MSSSISGGTVVCERGSPYLEKQSFLLFNKGTCWETLFSKTDCERYRLYFLFSLSAPSALEAMEGRDPGGSSALSATSWS